MGFTQVQVAQEYQTISLIMSQVLGGKKKDTKPPDTFEEAEAQLKGVFGGN